MVFGEDDQVTPTMSKTGTYKPWQPAESGSGEIANEPESPPTAVNQPVSRQRQPATVTPSVKTPAGEGSPHAAGRIPRTYVQPGRPSSSKNCSC